MCGMTRLHDLMLAAGAAAVAVGCGSANAEAPQNPNPTDESHQGNAGEVTEGGAIYLARCAKCHGPTGKGTDEAPALVGANALPLDPPPTAKVRRTRFATAKDVFDFVKANMPADKPGTLSDDQVYEVLTFDLKLNGVDLHGLKVDPTTAPTVRLPNR